LRKKWLANAVLALASVTATLAVLEIAVRVARWRSPDAVAAPIVDEHDPTLGWRKRPGARSYFRSSEYDVPLDINSLGLRDPERGYTAAPGTRRILALGDSFAEGYGVRAEDGVTQLLERRLVGSGCRFDVINGGTTGYATDQEYLFYKHEGTRYSPSIVVLFFYYNDILYNTRAGHRHPARAKPVFIVENDRLVLWNVPVPTSIEAGPARGRDGAPPSGLRSALFDWVHDRMRNGAPRAHNALARLGLWEPIDAVEPALELKVYKRKRVDTIEDAWERTAVILRTLARDVEGSGARFLAVYVPSAMEIDDRAWELSQLRHGFGDDQWDRGGVLRRLQEIGREHRFPVLDPTRALKEVQGKLGGPYFPFDGHWNELGHRVAAREVEAYLRAERWLTDCPAAP
jgi:lysophospholipase L1-like esterase